MKKLTSLDIWSFLLISFFLFIFALIVFDISDNSTVYPCKRQKLESLLEGKNNKGLKEKIIPLILLCNRADGDIFLWIGDFYEKEGDLIEALNYYQQALNLNPLGGYETYRKINKIYKNLGQTKAKEDMMLFLFEKLKKVDHISGFTINLAKEFYLIGEEYHKYGDIEKTIYFWTKAKDILPQWSYFYIELAALYFDNENYHKAKEILTKCLQFKYPKEHCQEYLNSGLRQLEIQLPGYWHKEILAIIDY